MAISNLRRVGTAVAGGTAIVAPAAFIATPAFSVSSSCGGVVGAVEVHDGVCEYVYDEPGEYTFEAPAGVAKIAAVVAGGGGGAYVLVDDDTGSGGILFQYAYGGGGGEVVMTVVDSPTGSYDLLVGAGGGADGDKPGSGEDSTFDVVTARGGGVSNGVDGAPSGNENDGSGYSYDDSKFKEAYSSHLYGGGGGGTGGATDNWIGGEGLAFSDFKGYDTQLFPSDTGYFGKGGSVIDETTAPEITPNSFNPANGVSSPLAGEGGSAKVNRLTASDSGYATSLDGEDGMVLLRWVGESDATDDGSLPETGADIKPWTLAAALGSIAAGTLAVLRSRRRVNN